MKNTTLLIFILILLSCSDNIKDHKLKGIEIEINYDIFKIKSINDNDYISIDNIKYIHKSKIDHSIGNHYLPSSENLFLSVEGKEHKEEGNIINISTALLTKLRKTGNYQFKNPAKNVLIGKIVLKRKDNKPISIQVSKNYPIKTKVIK